MKPNFVVSACTEAWVDGARELIVADPYVVHVLETTGRLADFEMLRVAPQQRATREAFQRDHNFVDRKFHKYRPILVHRLEQLHAGHYGETFWNKALALAIQRHISLCYDLFQVCEKEFDAERHDCRLLDPDSYLVPDDFDEHRRIFQSTGRSNRCSRRR